MDELFEESERLVVELLQLIDLPTIDSERVLISDTACSLALEHWHAVRALLELGLLPSALVVHRSQFEALVRSVWLTYVARDADLAKLTATLDLESEQVGQEHSDRQRHDATHPGEGHPRLRIARSLVSRRTTGRRSIPIRMPVSIHCVGMPMDTRNRCRRSCYRMQMVLAS